MVAEMARLADVRGVCGGGETCADQGVVLEKGGRGGGVWGVGRLGGAQGLLVGKRGGAVGQEDVGDEGEGEQVGRVDAAQKEAQVGEVVLDGAEEARARVRAAHGHGGVGDRAGRRAQVRERGAVEAATGVRGSERGRVRRRRRGRNKQTRLDV